MPQFCHGMTADAPTGTAGPNVTSTVTLPQDFGIPQMSALAHDLAIELLPVPDILKHHGLTRAQYDHLLTVPVFEAMLKQACELWHQPTSVPERLALQSQLIVEKTLPVVGGRIRNEREDLPAVIEGMKALMKLGGLGEAKQAQGPQDRFVINIDLGGDRITFDSAAPVIDASRTTPLSPTDIQTLPEGERDRPALQSEPQGAREKPPGTQ